MHAKKLGQGSRKDDVAQAHRGMYSSPLWSTGFVPYVAVLIRELGGGAARLVWADRKTRWI